jgi:mitochondrial fission protein ELM1
MIRRDRIGMIVTTSRRTAPAVKKILHQTLEPFGASIWDGEGENPYFGMLACADMIVVTVDSISMVSEAVATSAPVLLAELPGESRRISLFLNMLLEANRVRQFCGQVEYWPVLPLDDTAMAAEQVRKRLGI